MKVSLIANDTTYIYNLRKEVIERLIKEGHQVELICESLLYVDELEKLGCSIVKVNTGRHGTNPFADLALLQNYKKILKQSKPDIVLTYNIKPCSYGGMACRMLKLPYMPNITGLGTAVENASAIQKIAIMLYKLGVRNAKCIFFQNIDNQKFFEDHNMIGKNTKVCLLPGSGVNLEKHKLLPYPEDDNIIHFQFTSRILKEKGVDLYIEAARIIHKKYPNTVFNICGGCDDDKYLQILEDAEKEGCIKYHGQQKDIRPFLKQASCIVHTSYYPEGMSNVLLEAAASGRPIIATDRSGCRETVDDGVTGYIIPIKNLDSLVKAIEKILSMSVEERKNMGLAGRKKMEQEFDRNIVVEAYLNSLKYEMV